MAKWVRGYKGIALLQILVCAAFFINPGSESYGDVFGYVNFLGAGILFFGSIIAYFEQRKWTLQLLSAAMTLLIAFNIPWFIVHGDFLSTGFPLIAYDALFVIANLHYLGKGI